MISMSITGVCNACEFIDLHLREASVYAGNKKYTSYQLECSHSQVCNKLIEELRNGRISAPEDDQHES